jgi:pyridoxine 4-dehydrogenase
VSVQNLHNLIHRDGGDVLNWAEENGIAFIPYLPLATGGLTGEDSPLTQLAADHRTTPAQLALAWLLRRSPVILPIPGTSSIVHLEDNIAAAAIQLSDAKFNALSDAASSAQRGAPRSALAVRLRAKRIRSRRPGGHRMSPRANPSPHVPARTW